MSKKRLQYKEAFAFGHKFYGIPGNIDDLITLEKEGCIYAHFWDGLSQTFKYYKVKFTPSEIFQFVEASIGKTQFDCAINEGKSFKEALDAIENKEIARKVISYGNYGKTKLKNGSIADLRGCLASFFPADLEKLVCGGKHERYESMFEDNSINKTKLIYSQLDQFPIIVNFITKRKNERTSFVIENECDVQDLLFVCLKSVFQDVKLEEWTTKHGGKSKRIDIVIPQIDTVIEVKFIRDQRHGNNVSDELKIDIESYHIHPNCKTLICFIYDPKGYISDPLILIQDLSGTRIKNNSEFDVKIFIRK
jgi:hypothetical protein